MEKQGTHSSTPKPSHVLVTEDPQLQAAEELLDDELLPDLPENGELFFRARLDQRRRRLTLGDNP